MDRREAVELACILEATARKPGNVHCQRDFAQLTYLDLLRSAVAIGPSMAAAPSRGVGETILGAIAASRRVVRTNTNLGIVLLLAPLCVADDDSPIAQVPAWRRRLEKALANLTVADARAAYEAIRLAEPGGMGEAPEQDVRREPTVDLRAAMALAADRDAIAAQYVRGFADVFEIGLPSLLESLEAGASVEEATIVCQLTWMAERPDSLIRRKRGEREADESARRAAEVLGKGGGRRIPGGMGSPLLRELDDWLAAASAQRNPGTSADLTAATLFVWLRTGGGQAELLHFSQRTPST